MSTKTLSLTQAHEYTVTSPKSEASKRDIPMNETIKKILMNQKKENAYGIWRQFRKIREPHFCNIHRKGH